MELTCGWGTLRLVGSNAWLGSPSHQMSPSAPPSPETAGPAFLRENSSAYEIYRWLCLGADAPAGPSAPTAAAAIAQARAQFLGKTGSIPVDPIMRKPGFPRFGDQPHRYGVAVREPKGGGLVFVDWAGLARKGDVVLANTVWVLGPQTFRLHGRVALRSIVFDCRINRAKVVLRSTWRSDGLRLAFTRVEEPATDVTPGSVEAGLLKAVCPGVEPSETRPNVEAIIAYSNQAGSSLALQSR